MAIKQPTAAEIQTKLKSRKESLSEHLAAIRGELAPLANGSGKISLSEAGDSISTKERAGIAFGGALLVALAVGLRSRRKKRNRAEKKGAAVRLYVDYLLDEAALLVARGKDPEKALRKVLRRKGASEQIDSVAPAEQQSVLSELTSAATKTALIMVVEEVVGRVLAHVKTSAGQTSPEQAESSGSNAA